MKKIAVLIPSYMPHEYFRRCLHSLDEQSLDKRSFRVYVALNGPRDPYEDKVKRYLDEFSFSYEYMYVENPGVSNARNLLMQRSTEEYITFIDDDDVVSKNYLECLLAVSAPFIVGISNVFSFHVNCEEVDSNFIGRSFPKLAPFEKSKVRARKYFSAPWAKMIHRNVISNNYFDVNVAKGEDSLFMAQLSNKIEALQKTTETACYYVNERPGSVTRRSTSSVKEMKTLTYLLKNYLVLLMKPGYDKCFILTRLAATLIKLFKVGLFIK